MANFNSHFDDSLFIARVTNIRLEDEYDETGKIAFGAGTIDVMPPVHRMGIRGVRVVCPNTARDGKISRGSYWLPAIGDLVVCGYLEGYPDHAICLGAIYYPGYNTPPEAALSNNRLTYQMNDIVFEHKAGGFIRLRNKNQPYKDTAGIWTDPQERLSEIRVEHPAGDILKIDETVVNQTEFTYTHNTGTQIKIGTDGTITLNGGSTIVINRAGDIVLTPASGKKVKIGSSGSAESLMLGDYFKDTWWATTIKPYLDNHIHPTGVGPSGVSTTPCPVFPTAGLSVKAKTET